MRFVPIKTDDQLDMQSLHRVRERWVMRRTAVVNQIRGLLLERGIRCGRGGAMWIGLARNPGGRPPSSRVPCAAAGTTEAGTRSMAMRIDEADAVIQKKLARTKPADG